MKKEKSQLNKIKKLIPNQELQNAIDAFPKAVKLKEKAAIEKKKIMKNFMSVKKQVYK